MLKGTLLGLGGGVNAFFCSVSCCQSVKCHEDLLEMRNFQCIRGGSVLPPLSSCTLGQAMRQKVRRLALVEVCMHFSLLFLVWSVWENVLHGYNSGGNVV